MTTLQHIRAGSVNYICTGAGASAGGVGAVEGMLFHGSRPGFAMVTLESDALRLQVRDDGWRTFYQASMTMAGDLGKWPQCAIEDMGRDGAATPLAGRAR